MTISMPSPVSSAAVIFIDATVANYQHVVGDVGPDATVIVLDPTRDGILQITEALAQQSGIARLHIVSCGQAGRLQLGSSHLDLANLSTYGWELQQWAESLKSNAYILLHGCDVADEQAEALLRQIRLLTGVTVVTA